MFNVQQFAGSQGFGGPEGPRRGRGPGGPRRGRRPGGPRQGQGPGGPRRGRRRGGPEQGFQGNEDISFPGNRFGNRMRGARGRGQGRGANLTQEQRQEVRTLIENARADGTVTSEERASIGDLFRSLRAAE